MGCFWFTEGRILFYSGIVGHADGEMTVVKGEEFIHSFLEEVWGSTRVGSR